jgi:hypothetical protein
MTWGAFVYRWRKCRDTFSFSKTEEDQIVDLQDDSTAVEEGLKTASGMIRDLSLPRVGRQFHSLEVRQESGQQVLKIDITATRTR